MGSASARGVGGDLARTVEVLRVSPLPDLTVALRASQEKETAAGGQPAPAALDR
jgi:hypothetical protein